MKTPTDDHFERQYQTHLKHLKLKGLQPKTIEAYARAIRRIGDYFDHQIDALTAVQLTDYFTDLVASYSWNSVKLDLYGLKFYYAHVLRQPWVAPGLIKPPRSQRLPDIVTVDEARRLFAATRVVSYRVFYFTLYTVWGYAWARDCGFRRATWMRYASACMSATPKAIGIASSRCHNQLTRFCAASGGCIATRCCCFPIATAA